MYANVAYKTKLMIGAIFIWVIGGLGGALLMLVSIAYRRQEAVHFRFLIKDVAVGGISTSPLYYSIPFLGLAILSIVLLKNPNLPSRMFLRRITGIICSFGLMLGFYGIYSLYIATVWEIDMIAFAFCPLMPYLNIIVLPLGYFLGAFLIPTIFPKFIEGGIRDVVD